MNFKALKRSPDGHKGTFGHLLIVAGSRMMPGAAALTARSALRSGVGKVSVATTKTVVSILAPHIPEAMWIQFPEDSAGKMLVNYRELAEQISARKITAIAAGPGIGVTRPLRKLIQFLIFNSEIPVLLDADALNNLASISMCEALNGNVVLTPHDAEYARLFGTEHMSTINRRKASCRHSADSTGAVILLKGKPTLVAGRRKSVYRNTTGNVALATAGSGDVLTGMIGAFLARNIPPYEAACLGAHIHGLASDEWVRTFSNNSMIASDIICLLPGVMKRLKI